MYIYQLTLAFYKNLSDKFNPVWLKKAELHIPPSKLGLNAELNRLVITCNTMIKHDYNTILPHKEEYWVQFRRESATDSYLSGIKRVCHCIYFSHN